MTLQGHSAGDTAMSPACSGVAHTPSPTASGTERGKRLRSRLSLRRDKPLLSCVLCRKRKVRCDRQIPCTTCSRRGLARSCVYSNEAQEVILPRSAGSVHERIHQLESLIISLAGENTNAPFCLTTDGGSTSDPPKISARLQGNTDADSSRLDDPALQGPLVTAVSSATPSASCVSSIIIEANASISSVPLDGGCMKFNSSGTGKYVSSSHWEAILDSIAELKDHFEKEEQIRFMATNSQPGNTVHHCWPQLLYSNQQVTKAEILSSIPPRRIADRLVSRYFGLNIASGVLHSGQFLREYAQFWEDPSATSIMWLGLLFTILCLGELDRTSLAPESNKFQMTMLLSESLLSTNIFRQRIVQCLMVGRYTKGGPYVLETLLQYYMIEHFLRQDAEFDIWILLGMLIPISLRMGMHRDPKHFDEISVFAGEMRRRIWATIFQIDVGFSALAGLPRMIKPHQCDTEEPHNLLDSDFDETKTELPQSRPESEATPVLFLLAKTRIISIGGLITDLAHDVRQYPYAELTRFEKLLQETRSSIPSSLQWQSHSQSIIHGPQEIMQRAYLDMFYHKMLIILYKKYLSASMAQPQFIHAREVCLDSAIQIIEHQHLLDEESQLDGRLSSIRWTYSSLLNYDFMLAASILCFFIKQHNGDEKDVIDQEIFERICSLLRKSHDIWTHSSTESEEAKKAVKSLSIVLGIHQHGEDSEIVNQVSDASADCFAQFNSSSSWPIYQDYITSSSLSSLGPGVDLDKYWAVPS